MLASTQFESVFARRAFPCFDEPTYKAHFDIQLEVDEQLTALSNMNVTEEKVIGNGKKLVTFARTPLMSTYLVAFAVGEFEYIEVDFWLYVKGVPSRPVAGGGGILATCLPESYFLLTSFEWTFFLIL